MDLEEVSMKGFAGYDKKKDPLLADRLWIRLENRPGSEGLVGHFLIHRYLQSGGDFDHAYAITLHKAQGKTVDWSMMYTTRALNAYGTYVGLTRHRETVDIFYSIKDFPTFKAWQQHLSRVQMKDLVKDYTIRPENKTAHQRVPAILILGFLQSILDKIQEMFPGLEEMKECQSV